MTEGVSLPRSSHKVQVEKDPKPGTSTDPHYISVVRYAPPLTVLWSSASDVVFRVPLWWNFTKRRR